MNLKKQSLSGFIWTFIDTFFVRGFMFIAMILLARWIGPVDFGLVGMIAIFLAIGRLTKQKNFSFLIECFNQIIKKNNLINLVIIGEGEEFKVLKKIIKNYEMENNIFLIGYQKNVFGYLKNCEAFILSSLWEDPGFVVVEAMFSNAFVLSSDC